MSNVSEETKQEIMDILSIIKHRGLSLDFNTAGLHKKYCLEPYPSAWIVKEAHKLGIPFIFGSDAHAVDQVGRAYDIYENRCITVSPRC